MNQDDHNKVKENIENKDERGGVLSYVFSFLIMLGAIYGFKYIKIKLFPNKQILLVKEIYDLNRKNKGKKIQSFISEKPISSGIEGRDEILIRRMINLELKFNNSNMAYLNSCTSSLSPPISNNFRNESKKCYNELIKTKNEYTSLINNQEKLINSLSNKNLKQSMKIKLEKDQKLLLNFFNQFSHVQLLLSKDTYSIKEGRVYFHSQTDLDQFKKYLYNIEYIGTKMANREKRRLDYLEKNSKEEVKISSSDILMSVLGSAVRRR